MLKKYQYVAKGKTVVVVCMVKVSGMLFPWNLNLLSCVSKVIRLKGNFRDNIKRGSLVKVIQKVDQKTDKLTEGVVKEILTNSKSHPHGIKVLLESGIIGRVKEVVDDYKRWSLKNKGYCMYLKPTGFFYFICVLHDA